MASASRAQPLGRVGLLPPPGSAPRSRAERSAGRAMGSPALRPALLPLLLLLLLLRVPPSRGFPGRVGGPASPAGRRDPRLGPEGGAGRPLFAWTSSFAARGSGGRGTGLASGHQEGRVDCHPVAGRRELEDPLRLGFQGDQSNPRWRWRRPGEVWPRVTFSPRRSFASHTVACGQGPGGWQLILEGAPTPSNSRPQATPWGCRARATVKDSRGRPGRSLSRIPQPPLLGIPRKSAPPGERCQLRAVTCGRRLVSPRERGLHTRALLDRGCGFLLLGGVVCSI